MRKELIEKLVENYRKIENDMEALGEYFGMDMAEGKLGSDIYAMFGDYLKAVASAVNVSEESLSWFVYDNNCGLKGYKCEYAGTQINIKTVDDFLKFEDICE